MVLLHPVAVASDGNGESLRVLRLLLKELPLKTAVRLAAEVTGASRNALYDTALEWKRERRWRSRPQRLRETGAWAEPHRQARASSTQGPMMRCRHHRRACPCRTCA